MNMNETWLLENSNILIKHILKKDGDYHNELLINDEVQYWLSQLKSRWENNEIGAVHGSHDYRMENILGKCSILGLSKEIPVFNQYMKFILDFLNRHINKLNDNELSFGKIYSYRDYETVLSCFLPMLGYTDEQSVLYITEKRLKILYNFTEQKRYDIYIDGSKLKGVRKEWQPYVIDPDLYSDGNIALPTMHDFILFAGMYKKLGEENKVKVNSVVEWVFDEQYKNISRRYGYFYVPGGTYNVKAVIFKMQLFDFKNMIFDKSDISGLIYTCFVLSHFDSAKSSEWFNLAMVHLNNYKSLDNHYIFPGYMINEKKDSYVINGEHMNIGENRRSKQYNEIVSTYWMERIYRNLSE